MTERDDSANAEKPNQQAQQELVDQALKLPGIADVLAVYGQLAPYAQRTASPGPIVRFATGGNR